MCDPHSLDALFYCWSQSNSVNPIVRPIFQYVSRMAGHSPYGGFYNYRTTFDLASLIYPCYLFYFIKKTFSVFFVFEEWPYKNLINTTT